MSDRRCDPPTAITKPAKDWSTAERQSVVSYVRTVLREQLTIRAWNRYRRIHSAPAELVSTYFSSDHFTRALDAYDPAKGRFRSLIVTSFHRHCIDQLRWLYKRRRHGGKAKVVLVEMSETRFEALLAMYEGEVMPLAVALERRRLFRTALAALPPRQRDLLLAQANGHSYEEIRAYFGYATINTVRTKIAVARRRFVAEAAGVGLTARSMRKGNRRDARE